MKKKRFAWLCLLLPLFAFAQPGQHPVKVACMGNSITEGYGLQHPDTESWPSVLQQLLGDGYSVKNFGASGRTLTIEGDVPYMKEQCFKNALASLPDVAIIKLGTNDSKAWNWQHKQEFKTDLRTLIHALDTLSSHPRIYLCLPIPANENPYSINDSIIRNGIIPRIREVAHECHLPVIDLYTQMRPYCQKECPDGVHPDKEGAARLAGFIYQAIRKEVPTAYTEEKNLPSHKKNYLCGKENEPHCHSTVETGDKQY